MGHEACVKDLVKFQVICCSICEGGALMRAAGLDDQLLLQRQ